MSLCFPISLYLSWNDSQIPSTENKSTNLEHCKKKTNKQKTMKNVFFYWKKLYLSETSGLMTDTKVLSAIILCKINHYKSPVVLVSGDQN